MDNQNEIALASHVQADDSYRDSNAVNPEEKYALEQAELTLRKTADQSSVQNGDLITYTIVVTNTGAIPVEDIILIDPLPTGTSYVFGSTSIDDNPPINQNPADGIPLGILLPTVATTVQFQVSVMIKTMGGII